MFLAVLESMVVRVESQSDSSIASPPRASRLLACGVVFAILLALVSLSPRLGKGLRTGSVKFTSEKKSLGARRRSPARKSGLSVAAMREVQLAPRSLKRNPETARGSAAVQVERNSSYLADTTRLETGWDGIDGITASGDILPVSSLIRRAGTAQDYLTEITLALREYEYRAAHGLIGPADEKAQADRMSDYAARIGNEVVAYHSGYHRRKAGDAARRLIDDESSVVHILKVPVGGAIFLASWGTGTPIKFKLMPGVTLRNETVVLGRSTRFALSSEVVDSDFRVDFSNPEWSWYSASLSRGLLIDGLSARLSSVRPVSSDQVWAGQGPISEEALALEYRIRF